MKKIRKFIPTIASFGTVVSVAMTVSCGVHREGNGNNGNVQFSEEEKQIKNSMNQLIDYLKQFPQFKMYEPYLNLIDPIESIVSKIVNPSETMNFMAMIMTTPDLENNFAQIAQTLPQLIKKDQHFGNVHGYTIDKLISSIQRLYFALDFSNVPNKEAPFFHIFANDGETLKVDGKTYTFSSQTENVAWAYQDDQLNIVSGSGAKTFGWYSTPQNINGQMVPVKLNERIQFYKSENSEDLFTKPAGISDVLPNLATDVYEIHGIKAVELLIGFLIYISADSSNFGSIDRSSDEVIEDIKKVIVPMVNMRLNQKITSIANLLTLSLSAPILDGNVNMQNGHEISSHMEEFVGEIKRTSLEFGLDISAVLPKNHFDDWFGNVFLGDATKNILPMLTVALQKIGIK